LQKALSQFIIAPGAQASRRCEKRKEGKKRMRQFGEVEIPQSAFIAAFKMGDG
jgi:translation elongation factor EF-4